MSETSTTLGLLSEIFTIVCFPIGLVLLIMALIIRAIRGGWGDAEAAVSRTVSRTASRGKPGTVGGSELRWLGPDGTLYTQRLDDDDADALAGTDDVTVYYRTFSPYRAQLERVAHDEKLLRVLGYVFVGVGVAAVIVSIVATLIS
jgi:hypothetical protein